MEKRIKALEIEIAYLRKSIEELKGILIRTPIEVHTHHHYDFSKMKPMIVNNSKFNDDPK